MVHQSIGNQAIDAEGTNEMNATSNNTIRNATQNIATIIAGVMKDATTEGNRQAELTVAMFKNEVTYAADEIVNVFRKEGSEKTALIDAMLSDASDEYKAVMEHGASIKDKPSKERTTQDVFALDGLNRKARAARIMFERALKSVYWLRVNGCKTVAGNKIGTGALKAKMPDPEDEGEFVNEVFTCNHVANKGKEAIDKALGKAKPEAKARNPQANVLADASKSLAAVLTGMNAEGKRKPLTDFNDGIESQLEDTLRELFAMKFFDGNVFDRKTFDAWIAETYKTEKQEAAKQNAGTSKDVKAA